MRVIQIKIYRYAELTAAAQERARQETAEAWGFQGADEALASLQALVAHFGAELVDYEIDYFAGVPCSPPRFAVPELEPEEIAERLEQLGDYNPETLKGKGDCKLTGVCYDEDAIDGLRIAYHAGERNVDKLLQAGYETWLAACQRECRSFYDDEEGQFADFAEANQLEFYVHGHRYRRRKSKPAARQRS